MSIRRIVITAEIQDDDNQTKLIENCSLEELYDILLNVGRNKIDLAYDYIHKDNFTTAYSFATNHNISESYLYKIIKEIKEAYNKAVETKSR